MCKGFVKGDANQAKDLCQEVYINVWHAMERFRGESSYKTWIYRITANTCLQYLRDTKKREVVSMDHISNKLSYDPQQSMENPNQALYLAIGELNKVDRLIIMMVLDELDQEEISKVMGLSAGNLRVKIHRIKKSLREILRKEEENG
jgi:RNA polymerase sigma-70 factor (ECF subfamily)